MIVSIIHDHHRANVDDHIGNLSEISDPAMNKNSGPVYDTLLLRLIPGIFIIVRIPRQFLALPYPLVGL